MKPKAENLLNYRKQLFCFFLDGTSLALTRFDELVRGCGSLCNLYNEKGRIAQWQKRTNLFHSASHGPLSLGSLFFPLSQKGTKTCLPQAGLSATGRPVCYRQGGLSFESISESQWSHHPYLSLEYWDLELVLLYDRQVQRTGRGI